jgi:hypothetical protein
MDPQVAHMLVTNRIAETHRQLVLERMAGRARQGMRDVRRVARASIVQPLMRRSTVAVGPSSRLS